MSRSRRRPAALIVLACLIGGLLPLVAATPASAAPTLSVSVITWDVIGLDSNRPQSNDFFFPVRAKVCNTSSETASNVATSWSWVTTDSDIVLVNSSSTTRSLGTLAAGGCAIASYNVKAVKGPTSQAFPSTPNTAQYTITASATGATNVTTSTRTLYLQKLISQSRNGIVNVSVKSVADGTTTCATSVSTTCTVYEGQTYTFTLHAKTATAYNQVQSHLLIPDTMFTITNIKSTYATPSGATGTSDYANACGWSGPTTSSAGSCVGPVNFTGGKAGGNPIKVVYTAKVNAGAAGSTCTSCMGAMINDFSGSSFHYNADTNVSGNKFTVAAKMAADLKLTKSHTGALQQGTNSTYTLTVTNDGPSATSNTIQVRDELPAGITLRSPGASGTPGTWSCTTTAGSTSVNCSSSTAINSGSSATITVPVAIDAGATTGAATNNAITCFSSSSLSSMTSCPTQPTTGSIDTDLTNNTAADPGTIAAPPDTDLVLTKSHTGNFTRGSNGSYTLTLRNDGPAATTSAPQIVDTLPAGMTYVSRTGSNWTCAASGQTVTCDYNSTLASGVTAQALVLTVAVGASTADLVTNVASATVTGTTDPNTSNNVSISDTTIVGQADVTLSISHTGNFAIPTTSGTGTFTVTVDNDGPNTANQPIEVVLTLPTGLTYNSVSGTGWTCSASGSTVTCTRSSSLGSGSSTSFDLIVSVASSLSDATLLSISGIACSGTPQLNSTTGLYDCPSTDGTGFVTYDPDLTNNRADDAVTAFKLTDLSITKTGSHSSITVQSNGQNESMTYTINVTSNGTVQATNVGWTDVLPTGATFSSGTMSGSTTTFDNSCNQVGQEVSCSIGTLAASTTTGSTTGQVVLTVTVNKNSPTTITNSVSVSADQGDSDATNDSASFATTITGANPAPSVSITLPASSVTESSTTERTITWTATDSSGGTISSVTTSCGSGGTKVASSDSITSGALSSGSVGGSFRCIFDDGGTTSDVTVTATDDLGLGTTGSATITVTNVAPSGIFNAPTSTSTNATFTISITSPSDASASDTTAGFEYSFDCGSGTFSDWSTSNDESCTAPGTAGTVTVVGKIRDKDLGSTTLASELVTVNGTNSAPTATPQTVANSNAVSVNEDASVLITLAGSDPDGDNLTFKVTSLPSNGKLYEGNSTAATDEITAASTESPAVLSGATATFVPTANYNNGSATSGPSFTFVVSDGALTSSAATVQIDVDPINDTPTWNSTVSMSSSATLDLTTVSADIETADADLVYSLVGADGGATKGTASLTGTNNKTLNYSFVSGSGNDSVTVRVTDRGDPDNCGTVVTGSCTAALTADKAVTIVLSNNAPTATSQTVAGSNKVSVDEDSSVLITLAGADVDGDPLSIKITSLPSNGKLYKGSSTDAADEITSASSGSPVTLTGATVTFVPNANYNNGASASGPSFTFVVNDGTVDSSAATVEIDVNPVNDTPAAADSTTTTLSGTATINLVNITTDTETASANHTYKVTSLPAAGTLKDGSTTITSGALPYTMTNGTTLTYTQPANRTADVTFEYSATDRGDPDNCGTVVSGACTAALSDAGTITVDVTNAGPTATSQTVAGSNKVSVDEDSSVLITLAGTDSEGDTLTFKITSLPSNGKLYKGSSTDAADEITSASSGSPVTLTGATVTFVPNANYNNGASASSPSFTFTATDVSGSNTASSAATIEIDVNPVNDTPTWDATVSMASTSTLDLRTVSADTETADDNLSYSIVTNGTKGTASLSGTNNRTLSYSKTVGQTGSDSVVIRVTDRGDPDNCGSVVAGSCTATLTADKTITINLSNSAPTAGVTLHTLPNTGDPAVLSGTQPPKTNDKVRATATCGDVDGDNVTLTFVWKVRRVGPPVTTETVQTTTVSAGLCTGTYTDTLDLSKAGFGDKGESIIVEVTPNDGTVNGTTATGSTTVVVSDTPPTATDRIVKTGVNQSKSIVLEGSDIDGEQVTFTITQQPSSGTLVVANDGTKNCFKAAGTVVERGSYTSPGTETCHLNATYTPADGVTGTVAFKYKVENSDAGSRIATVTIQIQATVETGINQTDDAEQETVQGALVSTGSQPSADDPVETQIVAVRNGRIVITEQPVTGSAPSGFSFFGQQVDIRVLDANDDPVTTLAGEPMRFTFFLDASILPTGKTVADVKVYRNGTEIADCTGGSNLVQPMPACVLTRTLSGGVIQIDILTSAASVWNFAVATPTGGGGGGGVAPSPSITPTPTISPSDPPDDIDPPRVKIRISDSTPRKGFSFLVKLRLAVCPGHEFTTIQLGHMKGGSIGEWVKIGEKQLDGNCYAQWGFKADFKKRLYRAIWAKQDDDHRQGRSRIREVVPHRRLPGPRLKLYVNNETPDFGDVLTFKTRIGRCAGLERDRIQLWRLVPGLTASEAAGRDNLLNMKDGVYRRLQTKRVNRDCYTEFKVTVNFQSATFRTIWPKQDPRYRMGRAEPVVVDTRSAGTSGAPAGPMTPVPERSPVATPSPVPSVVVSPEI